MIEIEKVSHFCVIGVLLLGEDLKHLYSIVKEASKKEHSKGLWLNRQKSVVLIEHSEGKDWFFDVRDEEEEQPVEVYISLDEFHCSCSIDVRVCRHICASIEAIQKKNFLIEEEISISYFLLLKPQGWIAARGILGSDTFHEISSLNEYIVDERHRVLDEFFKKYRG